MLKFVVPIIASLGIVSCGNSVSENSAHITSTEEKENKSPSLKEKLEELVGTLTKLERLEHWRRPLSEVKGPFENAVSHFPNSCLVPTREESDLIFNIWSRIGAMSFWTILPSVPLALLGSSASENVEKQMVQAISFEHYLGMFNRLYSLMQLSLVTGEKASKQSIEKMAKIFSIVNPQDLENEWRKEKERHSGVVSPYFLALFAKYHDLKQTYVPVDLERKANPIDLKIARSRLEKIGKKIALNASLQDREKARVIKIFDAIPEGFVESSYQEADLKVYAALIAHASRAKPMTEKMVRYLERLVLVAFKGYWPNQVPLEMVIGALAEHYGEALRLDHFKNPSFEENIEAKLNSDIRAKILELDAPSVGIGTYHSRIAIPERLIRPTSLMYVH